MVRGTSNIFERTDQGYFSVSFSSKMKAPLLTSFDPISAHECLDRITDRERFAYISVVVAACVVYNIIIMLAFESITHGHLVDIHCDVTRISFNYSTTPAITVLG